MESQRTVKIIDTGGQPAGETPLPSAFDAPLRLDVIRKAVIAQQSHRLQRQGRDPMAGKRTTAEGFGVGRGISRVPRIGGGGPLSGSAAFAPGTVGGRLAFPPVSARNPAKSMNRKERKLALRSAIAATAVKEIVRKRGHLFGEDIELPIVVSDEFEKFSKTSEARKLLTALGVWDDIVRVSKSREHLRGKTKHAVGPLVVVSQYQGAERAFKNIAGVDVVKAQDLSVEQLAPGTHPGRLTIWSESAVKVVRGKEVV